MRSRVPDFSDAFAYLDWADRQIVNLATEIDAYVKTNPYTLTPERDVNGLTNIFLSGAQPVPTGIVASTNCILQAQRSSLDYMAVALAAANNATEDRLKKTYFPVAKSKDALMNAETRRKIRWLDPADQQRLLDLRPYPESENGLFILHDMNNEKKHRRLGVLANSANFAAVRGGPGGGREYGMRAYGPAILDGSRHLIATAHVEGNIEYLFKIDVAFCDLPRANATPPVLEVLRSFNGMCRSIGELLSE